MTRIQLPVVSVLTTNRDECPETSEYSASLRCFRETLPIEPDAYDSLESFPNETCKWMEILSNEASMPNVTVFARHEPSRDACRILNLNESESETNADVVLYHSITVPHKRKKGASSYVLLKTAEQYHFSNLRSACILCAQYKEVYVSSFSLGKCSDAYLVCKAFTGVRSTLPDPVDVPLWFMTRFSESLIIIGQSGLDHASDERAEGLTAWKARFLKEV